MTDLGTIEMACALMHYCGEPRPEREVVGKAKGLNAKMSDEMALGLVAMCMGKGWLEYDSTEFKTLRTTGKGTRACTDMEREGFQ